MQGAINIPVNATWEEYLEMEFPEDRVTESLLDPLSLGGGNPFAAKPVPQVTLSCFIPACSHRSFHQLHIPLSTSADASLPSTCMPLFLHKYPAEDSLREVKAMQEIVLHDACNPPLRCLSSCVNFICPPCVFPVNSLVPIILPLSPCPALS